MPQRLTNTRLRSPVNVTWEITRACNLRCNHCLSADLRTELPGDRGGHDEAPIERENRALNAIGSGAELDFSQCCALIEELADMQVFQVNFGGGEPFLREDFLDILRFAHSHGITTCVSTNGTVLDQALVEELLMMPPVYLQVSLDGARSETNDVIRGEGTFPRVIAAVEMLSERGYPDFSMNMVVTRLNVGEIADFDLLARHYGAKTRLSRFRPSGAGCSTWEDYRLTRDQLISLSGFLGDHPEILTGDSFFALAPDSRRSLGLDMCGAGKMTCAIAPDGGVYPCAFLCTPAFLAGNVTTEPLLDIFRSSPVLERFRELEVDVCRVCERFPACHGGCPAIACFLTGSPERPDPECLRTVLPATEAAPEVMATKGATSALRAAPPREAMAAKEVS